MWLELFIVGSFWFWALIAASATTVFLSIRSECGAPATVCLIVCGLMLWLFGDFNVFLWVWQNPVLLLQYGMIYLAVGVLWSLVKWKMLCNRVRDQLVESKEKFLASHKTDSITPDLYTRWVDYLRNVHWNVPERVYVSQPNDVIPRPRAYKSYIALWLTYWPFSTAHWLLNDMLEEVFSAIYRRISYIYQNIANSTFASLKEDLKERKNP